MGYFDDLQKTKDDEFILVHEYVKSLARENNSSVEATINYLLRSKLNRVYYKDEYGSYCEPYHEFCDDHPFKSCLDELKLDFEQKLSRANRFSKTADELEIFNEIKPINNFFKKTELPVIKPIDNKISEAPPPPNHIKANSPFKQKTIGEVIEAEKRKEAILPNEFQCMVMLYDYFTPHQACCFIAGLHPSFNGRDDDLEIAEFIIEGGFKSGKLIADDDGQIKDDDLKSFLYSKKWVMKGFNDEPMDNTSKKNQSNVPNQQLTDAQNKIAELEQQLADKEANASFMMGTPTVTQCDPKTIEQLNQELTAANIKIADLENQLAQARAELAYKPIIDEVELNPKTLSAVTRLLNVLFHKAQLDITAHKGTTNKNIVSSSTSLNAKITEKPVSHWIRQVQQLRIDTQDRNH